MTDRKDGGAAFPFQEQPGAVQPEYGMTLRDWFAGMALQGMLAYSHYNEGWGDYHNNGSATDLANAAYHRADAMIAEREKARGE